MRYHEHYDFKYPNNRYTFAQHVINEGHSFGPMNKIINVIHFERKVKMLDNLKKFYIYRETKNGKPDKRQTYRTGQSDIRSNSDAVFSKRAVHVGSGRDTNTRHPQGQYTRAVTQKPAQ